MLDFTATQLIRRAADLLDGAYRYGLDQDDLSDRALFALHEAASIQTELMRLTHYYSAHADTATDPVDALTQAADQLFDAVPHLRPSERLSITGHEIRLRRLADQVRP